MTSETHDPHDHDRREADKWHINREISLGDLLAIAVAIGSVITAYMSLSARVTVVEAMAAQNSAQLTGTVQEIKSELRRLSDRMERLFEQHMKDAGSGIGLRR